MVMNLAMAGLKEGSMGPGPRFDMRVNGYLRVGAARANPNSPNSRYWFRRLEEQFLPISPSPRVAIGSSLTPVFKVQPAALLQSPFSLPVTFSTLYPPTYQPGARPELIVGIYLLWSADAFILSRNFTLHSSPSTTAVEPSSVVLAGAGRRDGKTWRWQLSAHILHSAFGLFDG